MPDQAQILSFGFRIQTLKLPFRQEFKKALVVVAVNILPFCFTRYKIMYEFLIAITPLLGELTSI